MVQNVASRCFFVDLVFGLDWQGSGPIADGKFAVHHVPCQVKFEFENEANLVSWATINYRVTVSPPSVKTLMNNRRRRAKECQRKVEKDLESTKRRADEGEKQRGLLEAQLAEMELALEEKRRALAAVADEHRSLMTRVELRIAQGNLLATRV